MPDLFPAIARNPAYATWTDDQVLLHWKALSANLLEIQRQEREARNEVIARKWPLGLTEGVNRIALGNGWFVKADGRVSYKFVGTVEQGDAAVNALFKLDPELGSKVFIQSYDLKVSEYKKLTGAALAIAQPLVEVKPGMPGLTIEPPKEK